jgi:tRNA C32,U32 (ribose-2'-O)-methylase TrmJ
VTLKPYDVIFFPPMETMTREETELCGELVHIATSAEHGSLNLAVATGIVLSALYTERSARGAERGQRPEQHERDGKRGGSR